MKEYTEKFKALSDETRLRILHLLLNAKTELCVCEFTDALEIPQYNISKHLKILRNVGLITERKESRWVYFGINSEKNPFVEAVMQTVRHIPRSLLKKDLVELRKRLEIRTKGKCLKGIQKQF